MFSPHHFFLKALSGPSKQGQVFRNSYATSHLCHEMSWAPSRRLMLWLRGLRGY
jgi:hypothetical protein